MNCPQTQAGHLERAFLGTGERVNEQAEVLLLYFEPKEMAKVIFLFLSCFAYCHTHHRTREQEASVFSFLAGQLQRRQGMGFEG